MATFNGQDIFGTSLTMKTTPAEVARQQSTAPGTNGIAEIVQGQRGGMTTCSGRLWGVDAAGLGAAESLFMSYYDGQKYALFDTLGRTWLYVTLQSFEPDDTPVVRDPVFGCSRRYRAVFFHQVLYQAVGGLFFAPPPSPGNGLFRIGV